MRILYIGILVLFTNVCYSFELKWPTITEKEWGVVESDSLGIHDAVLLSEKGHYDDTGSKYKYYYHRRIKIFNERGKVHGEIEIPYINKKQKYKKIMARTITPDGQILEIKKDDIREENVIKAGKFKMIQKQFVMPGMVDGCIIEYMYEVEFQTALDGWTFQNDLYTIKSMFLWETENNSGPWGSFRNKYTLLNCENYTPSIRNSVKDDKIIRTFELANLPVFEKEKFAPVTDELLVQVRIFKIPPLVYGVVDAYDQIDTLDEWAVFATYFNHFFIEFLKKHSRVTDILNSTIKVTDTPEEKAKKLYEYISENIVNTNYTDEENKKYKENNNINDVISRGYGSSTDINYLYACMLKELDMDATIGYVTDRSSSVFHSNVTDPRQFDMTLVVLRDQSKGDRFFCPGTPYTPYGYVPWFAIGTPVLALRMYKPWTMAKAGTANRNVYYSDSELFIENETSARCTTSVQLKGQFEQAYKLKYKLLDDENKQDEILSDLYPHVENAEIIDYSVMADSTDFTVTTKITVDEYCMNVGDRLLVTPALLIKAPKNPFEQEKRKNLVIFEFPYIRVDKLAIDIPSGYNVEEVPEKVVYNNTIGGFTTTYTVTDSTIQYFRQFILKGCFIKPEGYKVVKELFDKIQKSDENQLVLKKVSGEFSNE